MKPESRKRLFLIIAITVLSFFMANRIFFFKQGFLEYFSNNLIYPVLSIGNKIIQPIKTFFQKRAAYNQLYKEYLELKEESENLLAQNVKLKSSINYQEETREVLEFKKRYNLNTAIMAKVLAKNISQDEHYFLLNRGLNDGIKKDMVATYKFQLVGRITEVYRWHSKLLLVTDSNCKVAAYANSTNAKGIVVGENKINSYKMSYVSHLSQIQEDDLVLSSGQGLIFPEGFCLGKIINCQTEDIYHKITIKPLVDLSQISFCLLLNQEKIEAF